MVSIFINMISSMIKSKCNDNFFIDITFSGVFNSHDIMVLIGSNDVSSPSRGSFNLEVINSLIH